MHWKKNQITGTKTSNRNRSSDPDGECPLLNVVGASEYGVVLESQKGFDVGSALTIGFHVDGRNSSSFISAESIVVESHPEVVADGSLVYRVTLLFSNISAEDRRTLVNASEGFRAPQPNRMARFGLN